MNSMLFIFACNGNLIAMQSVRILSDFELFEKFLQTV